MTAFRRVLSAMMFTLAALASLGAQAQPSQQSEWVPIDQLPPMEQVAAAPLLIGAYSFVLAVLFFYVFSVARRLTNVQREIDRLETTLKANGRS